MSGYSQTPLLKKLGIKEGHLVYLYKPCTTLSSAIDEDKISLIQGSSAELDYVHIFANDLSALQIELLKARKRIKQKGMIWASWYKKSSKLQKEVNEDQIRALAFPLGLVDVKVCSIDEQWSGLKLVIRKELRL